MAGRCWRARSPGTQIWKVARQVGKVVPPENAQALSATILQLVNDPAEGWRLGKLGRNYTCQLLEKEVILSKFEHALSNLH